MSYKYQIPSTNNQTMTKISMTKIQKFQNLLVTHQLKPCAAGSLEFGDWILFGIWDLVIGI
jgi:hypothetical protein